MEKEKIIERIKKCLALHDGSNFEGEAEKALAAAMKLAAGIGMTVEEIKLAGEAENKANDILESILGKPRSKIPAWEYELSNGIASAIGCEMVFRKYWNETLNKRVENFLLIGTKTDAELFAWLYPYIIEQLRSLCHRDRKEYGISPERLKSWERDWYFGAAQRVVKDAKDKFKEQTTEQEQQQYALVIRDKHQKAMDYMKSNMNVKTSQSRSSLHNMQAARLGYMSAGEVSMNRPIANSSRQKIGA